MDVYEPLAQLLQDAQRYRRVVDEGAALACRGNFASHDALAVELNVVLLEERLQVVPLDVEGALDNTFGSSGAYGGRLGTLSGEQADGTEQDGLSRTGLTGNDRESLGEVEVERLDERVILYM